MPALGALYPYPFPSRGLIKLLDVYPNAKLCFHSRELLTSDSNKEISGEPNGSRRTNRGCFISRESLLHLFFQSNLIAAAHCPHYSRHESFLNNASIELTARCNICRFGSGNCVGRFEMKTIFKSYPTWRARDYWHIDKERRYRGIGGRGKRDFIRYVTKIFTIVSMSVLFAWPRAEYSWKFRNDGWFAIQTFWYFASRVNRPYNRGSPAKPIIHVRSGYVDHSATRDPLSAHCLSHIVPRVCEVEKHRWIKRVKKTRAVLPRCWHT